MRRLGVFTAFLFSTCMSFSQLYVRSSASTPETFLFVKGEMLYVSNDVQLESSFDRAANLFLREGGQLLQGEQQNIPNKGNGKISIFQEGTSNAFDYNYWSSPVSSTTTNLFGVSMLTSPFSDIESEPAVITTGLNGLAKPLTISSQWIFTFSGKDYSSWKFIGANTSIPPGLGFTMKGTNGQDWTMIEGRANNPGNSQRYDFRGRPNSGHFEVPVAAGDFVLIGNPYPSAVDISLFLLENSGSGNVKTHCYEDITRRNATTGIAYFWDSQENGSSHYLDDYVGGYGAFSPIDPCTTGVYERPLLKSVTKDEPAASAYGKHYERRFLPVGQGFMVQGVQDDKIVFRNGQRIFRKEGNYSQFKQTQNESGKSKDLAEVPVLRLQANINGRYSRSLSLAFWPDSTKKIDPGMDAAAYDLAPSDIGFLQQDQAYVIDVRPFDIADEIPLFLNIEDEEAVIDFSVVDPGKTGLKTVFILDTETGNYALLDKEHRMNLKKGDYSGRFKLVFTRNIVYLDLPEELGAPEEEEAGFDIFQNNHQGQLEIAANSFSPVRSVGIFDLQGKRLYFRSNFDNRRSININSRHWSNGVYIVKVTDMEGRKTNRKISVVNKS